jgi:hypothetical protein
MSLKLDVKEAPISVAAPTTIPESVQRADATQQHKPSSCEIAASEQAVDTITIANPIPRFVQQLRGQLHPLPVGPHQQVHQFRERAETVPQISHPEIHDFRDVGH